MKTKKIIKWSVCIILIALTINGTFSGVKESVWPFYQLKTGSSWGINICFITDYKGTSEKLVVHRGLDLSFATTQKNYSEIDGAGISAFRFENGESNILLKGFELSILNVPLNELKYYKKVSGLQIGIVNGSNIKGCQLGIVNFSDNMGIFQLGFSNICDENACQLGVWNAIGDRSSVGFNTDLLDED